MFKYFVRTHFTIKKPFAWAQLYIGLNLPWLASIVFRILLHIVKFQLTFTYKSVSYIKEILMRALFFIKYTWKWYELLYELVIDKVSDSCYTCIIRHIFLEKWWVIIDNPTRNNSEFMILLCFKTFQLNFN